MDIEDIIWPIIRMMNGDGSMRESDYVNIIDSLRWQRDEITQLRAELAAEREARESSEEWADIGINLFGKILYEFDACVDDSQLTDDPMENYLIIIRQAIKNATRRNK